MLQVITDLLKRLLDLLAEGVSLYAAYLKGKKDQQLEKANKDLSEELELRKKYEATSDELAKLSHDELVRLAEQKGWFRD